MIEPPRSRWLLAAARSAAVAAIWASPLAASQTVDTTAQAFSQGRPDPRDGSVATVVPNLVSASVVATDIKSPLLQDVRLVVSGWGGATVGDPLNGKVGVGDLDIGYLQSDSRYLVLRLGRQFLVGGVTRGLQLDGAFAGLLFPSSFGLDAYGGVPVAPIFGAAKGDAIGGGRFYWRPSFGTEVGASFVELFDRGIVGRQDAGVDARWAARADLVLQGSALFSLIEQRLEEGEAMVTYTPFRALLLELDWRRVAPDLYISRASLFSVFSEERRDEAGGTAFVQLSPRLSANAECHLLWMPEGTAQRAALELRYRLGPDGATQVALEGRLLDTPMNGYVQARAYLTHRVPSSLFVTVESDAYFFLQPINGHTAAYTATLTAGYDILPAWRVTLAAAGGSTPFLQWDLQYIAKLTWTPRFKLGPKEKS